MGCLLWRLELILLHAVSDTATFLASRFIPLVPGMLRLRRQDLIPPWAAGLFGAFILPCGAA
ncbi:hypothetical protein [Siccirubricoccus soli]